MRITSVRLVRLAPDLGSAAYTTQQTKDSPRRDRASLSGYFVACECKPQGRPCGFYAFVNSMGKSIGARVRREPPHREHFAMRNLRRQLTCQHNPPWIYWTNRDFYHKFCPESGTVNLVGKSIGVRVRCAGRLPPYHLPPVQKKVRVFVQWFVQLNFSFLLRKSYS